MTIAELDRAHVPTALDESTLTAAVTDALRRWPSAGVAIAIVGAHGISWSHLRGAADVGSARPVTADSVFRVGSLTKTVTAVAVLQLCEQGLVDLDAPANDYLRAFKLVPRDARFGPATVRHLLTHTAGVGYWRSLTDLLHPGLGSGDLARTVVPLGDYYRGGLRVDIEPGTRWAYSNHGFAALGQIVEDVSDEPLERYFRDHVFAPLGMGDSSLALSDRLAARLATGYVLRARGLVPVAHHEIPTPGGGGLYSTLRDMAVYLEALLGGGANGSGRVLSPETTSSMFRPHFSPDPRIAGMGLSFEPRDEGGRVLIGKGGTVSGFLSAMELAVEESVGAIVLTNTGGLDKRGVAEPLASALMRGLLALPDDLVRTDLAPMPERWAGLCGWYAPDGGPVTNLFLRATIGAGVEVTVRKRELVLRPLTPVPALRTPIVLHPDDPDDGRVFRIVFPEFQTASRVVFTTDSPPRLLIDVMSFEKRPAWRNPRLWATGLSTAGALAGALSRRRRLVGARPAGTCSAGRRRAARTGAGCC